MKVSCNGCYWKEQCSVHLYSQDSEPQNSNGKCEYYYPEQIDEMAEYELESDIAFKPNHWEPGYIVFDPDEE